MSEFLDAALELAKLGYSVFPLKPGGNTPLFPDGHKDATTDPERIKDWWSRYPQANIGVKTDGLIVVEVEPEGMKWEMLPKLIEAAGAVAITPRGGFQLWFRAKKEDKIDYPNGEVMQGIKVFGTGGYIIVPPSRIE